MNDIKLVEINNIKMNYFKFGNGNKNLIIIPGLSIKSVMLFKDAIINQYSLFEKDYTIYVFDRRLNIPSNYSIIDMANDQIDVLDYLKLNNLYVISVSQGAMISQIIASKRPDLINKLVLASTTDKIDNNSKKIFVEWVNLAKEYRKEELAISFLKYIYSKDFYDKYKELFVEQSKDYTKEELDKFVIMASTLTNVNILDNIKCKTFIVCSKADLVFDYHNSIRLNNEIKDSSIYIYDNASHALYDESPDFLSKVFEFFK